MKSQGRKADIRCPVCGSGHRIVTDSRSKENRGEPFIRRRIMCDNGHRYSTYERPAWAWTQEEDKKEIIKRIKELIGKL